MSASLTLSEQATAWSASQPSALSGRSVSVVIPAFNAAAHLTDVLAALLMSSDKPGEIIVVDDCSTDRTAEVARMAGARVIPTPARSGPARARNIGAAEAKGDLLVFLDADVRVHSDTITRILEEFEARPELDALMGRYDESPAEPDIISQYRNLLHSFVHLHGNSDAKSFWAGCGAIRRTAFLAQGGFDESYTEPAIEDIELGVRLVKAGGKIALSPLVEVTHLKKWGFVGLVRTDFLQRALPWTQLILRERSMPSDLNLHWGHRLSVALSCLLPVICLATVMADGGRSLMYGLAFVMLMMSTFWLERISMPSSKADRFALGLLSTGLVSLAVLHRAPVVVALVTAGYVLLLARRRWFSATYSSRVFSGRIYGIFLVCSALAIGAEMPKHLLAMVLTTCVAALILPNLSFYAFLGKHSGYLHALAVTPLHWLHYFSSGVAFLAGLILHLFAQPLIPLLRRRSLS